MEQIQVPSTNPSGNYPQSTPTASEPKNSAKREFLSVVGVVVLAPIIAVFLTVFVFQSYVVEGQSMETTLHDQDRLIVWKAAKTWSNVVQSDYVPDRYSIVIFQLDQGRTDEGKRQLIKRVIGVPGDRVVIKDGIVTVFNKDNPDGFYPDRVGPESNVIGNTEGDLEYTVKNGEVFVLGDNRGNSSDSRVFGAVQSDQIVGTLAVRIFPFNDAKKF